MIIGIFPSFVFLALSLWLVIKSADWAIRYSALLAASWRLPKYVIGFLVVAVISILPETFIAISSALDGVPAFGLGTLFGSNVADLTLVFALVVAISGRDLKIESSVIKNRWLYLAMMLLPIALGWNGYYSRPEGITLIALGLLFYLYILKHSRTIHADSTTKFSANHLMLLVGSMVLLLIGANFTVEYGVLLARGLQVSPILVGMFIVGLGTTLPELLFAVRAARTKKDGLALGDILGTAVADATVVVGIVATIEPFAFPPNIIYITAVFMALAAGLLLHLMKTGRLLTRREAFVLFAFYLIFVLTEFFLGGVSYLPY